MPDKRADEEIMASRERAMAVLYGEVGETRGELKALTRLVTEQVIPKLDALAGLPGKLDGHLADDQRIHADHETRVRDLESADNQEHGVKKSTARVWTVANAGLTLAINAIFVAVTWLTATHK